MNPGTSQCTLCGHVIQKMTAIANGGLCAQCVRLPARRIAARRQINAGLDPLQHAIELYGSLVAKIAKESAEHHWGGMGDPKFESVRFYTFENLTGGFEHDEAVEIGADEVDEIQGYLSEVKGARSLYLPLLQALKIIAPVTNAKGGIVFLGSWGMGPDEMGWGIRHLNDRPSFERYLKGAGITEAEVSAFDAAGP
jgi:hypothetical protein